jgi:hypothetical protein
MGSHRHGRRDQAAYIEWVRRRRGPRFTLAGLILLGSLLATMAVLMSLMTQL